MSWAVAYTKPACELMAANAIIEAGYRSYCPMMRVQLRGNPTKIGGARKGETVLRPLFPRYIFTELAEDGRFMGLIYARGVVDLIRGTDRRPQTVADEIIADIRRRETGMEFDQHVPMREFTAGSAVGISRDWGEMLGTLIRLDGADRAMALVNMFGREVKAKIQLDRPITKD